MSASEISPSIETNAICPAELQQMPLNLLYQDTMSGIIFVTTTNCRLWPVGLNRKCSLALERKTVAAKTWKDIWVILAMK
jgi:hypothetical protein